MTSRHAWAATALAAALAFDAMAADPAAPAKEWFAHGPLAIKAGLSPDIVADLKANKRPANMKPDEAAVYDFVTELSTRHEGVPAGKEPPFKVGEP